MSRLILNKYLGWVQRFLYHIEQGPLPPIHAALSIDHDWPLQFKRLQVNYTTIAGTFTTTAYAPGIENHGLVWTLSAFKSAAGLWLDTESFHLNYVDPVGTAVRLKTMVTPSAFLDHIPLIGAEDRAAVVAGSNPLAPVYVEPGASLQYIQESVAGGETGIILGIVLERQRSYPLSLP
jgi:hypothetical protein